MIPQISLFLYITTLQQVFNLFTQIIDEAILLYFINTLIEDSVTYTLGSSKSYDYVGITCGTSGQQSGLSITFPNTEIDSIPYRELIEVPFWVTTTGNCLNFLDVKLLIHSACESGDTYQYGVITNGGDVAVDYATVNSMSSSTATFSVSWKQPAGLSAAISSSASNDMTNTSEIFNIIRVLVNIILVLHAITVILFLGGVLRFKYLYRRRVLCQNVSKSKSTVL